MTFSRRSPIFSRFQNPARIQLAIYIGLTCLAFILLLPWPSQNMAVVANQIIELLLLSSVIGLAIRQFQLQVRLRQVEQRLRQLAPSQSRSYDHQSLPHMDVEQFFSKEQTRH